MCILKFFQSSSLFIKLARLTDSLSRRGNVPFAFRVTETVKPAIFAELETHSGNSYFAFCQSLPDNQSKHQTNTLTCIRSECKEQINKMIHSYTWRITKTLRRVSKSLKKRLRKFLKRYFQSLSKKIEQESDYKKWIQQYDTLTEEKIHDLRIRINRMGHLPLISVLMPVYNPSPEFLEKAIESVIQQLYPNWELCIADDNSTDARIQPLIKKYANSDSRIQYIFRNENGHISAASNSALELASGDYTALLDHDDLLTPDALYWIANEIINYPDSVIIYSDEDKLNAKGRRSDPYFGTGNGLGCFFQVFFPDKGHPVSDFRKLTTR